MERILNSWRIVGATLFSAVLIVGAYAFAKSIESPSLAEASAETDLLQAIAAKDTDGDGLPDWEEALYGTDSRILDSLKLGMSDGEAVARGLIVPKAIADIQVATSAPETLEGLDSSLPPPPAQGTLTAAFAEHFFTAYIAAKQAKGGANLSEDEMQTIAQQALASLSAAVKPAPDFKSEKDITVSGGGAEALKEFAVRAEAILVKNTSNASKSEILYLQDAVKKEDTTAPTHIASIAKAYRDSAVGIAMLPVPQELAPTALALVNALMRISEISTDFARVHNDPLATMLALHQYPQASQALGTAFVNIGKVYMTAGISLPEGAPGASFVNLIRDVAKEQSATKP